jgi:hypothetical protein
LAGFSSRQALDVGGNKKLVFTEVLPLLNDLNIVFVTPTGNGGQTINAFFLDETPPQNVAHAKGVSMIVVGGVNPDGTYDSITTPIAAEPEEDAPFVSIDVYAQSQMVLCAGPNADDAMVFREGTSYAAPAVVSFGFRTIDRQSLILIGWSSCILSRASVTERGRWYRSSGWPVQNTGGFEEFSCWESISTS